MAQVLAFASGKGGVGKSVLAANLAYQLAQKGSSVVLADLDWGGSNTHTVLGVLNTHAGVGQYILERTRPLADFLVPLEIPGLHFLPGDGGIAGGANLPLPMKQKLLRELGALKADYVVLDLGAGSHSNTIDAYLSSHIGFVVTTPEPTSLLNAYALLKTALYRLMVQAVPPKSEARSLLTAYFTGRAEKTDGPGLDALVQSVRRLEAAQGERLAMARQRLRPRVALNMVMSDKELRLGARLRLITEKQLGLAIEYVSLIPWDEAVRSSVIDRKLLSITQPEGPFATAVSDLADEITRTGFDHTPPWGTYTDLETLAN